MASYIYQTDEFGISETGIHLLRSGFNYQTIPFNELQAVRIENGKELHNWWLILLIGIVLTWIGIYLSVGAINLILQSNMTLRQAKIIFLLFIPLAGMYFIFNSFCSGYVLRIQSLDGKKNMFPLKAIVKVKKLKEFKAYMAARVKQTITPWLSPTTFP